MSGKQSDHPLGVVNLGEGSIVDAGAILGYLSPRKDVSDVLEIGRGARIRSGCVIYAGTRIGCEFETGHHSVVREQNEIGDHFSIWNNSVIDYGCKIGHRVKIHCNIYIAQFTVIEDGVFLAPGVKIANDYHPGCPESRECMRGPVLKRGCRIGVNTTILPYLIIGEETLIGSGSVVTKDIPAGVVAYGNPARVIGSIKDLRCKTGRREAPYL